VIVPRMSPETEALCAKTEEEKTSKHRKGVALAIGQTVVSDFRLQVSAVPVVVEVTDLPSIVEIDRGSQANSVPERYIADLPTDRRDYLTFALLIPGVGNSSVLAGYRCDRLS
jgi:hypothetical protein